jgi:hypothetical protein
MLVVLLDKLAHVLLRYMCCHVCVTFKACTGRYAPVRISFWSLTMRSNYFGRKLLAVDFVGAGLTLVGCTLVVLPLIWVSAIYLVTSRAQYTRI